MKKKSERILLVVLCLFCVVAFAGGTCTKTDRPVLRVDAEFDPGTASDTAAPVSEANPGVGQTYTVLASGEFEEFWLVVTQGESADDGTIRITVRPTNMAGEPDPDPNTSIIAPIDVDTSTLPATLVDEYTVFDLSSQGPIDVTAGEELAIVVDFVSRATSTDASPIARVLGQTGDPYPDGSGSTGESGVGFTNNTNDYFFRTFVLR